MITVGPVETEAGDSVLLNARCLDPLGRCCGRKPLSYKRGHPPHIHGAFLFCFRCDRAYDTESLCQIENWAWQKAGEDFVRRCRI